VLLVQGVLPVATVYLTRTVVNRLVPAVRAGGSWESLQPLIVAAVLMGAVLLAGEALRGIAGWLRTAQSELVQDYISGLIQEKSASVDLAFYESPEFYDHLHRARAEAGYRPIALVESLGSLMQNGITLVAMLAVLIPYGPWLPAALLVSTLPALYVVLRYALLQHQWSQRATPDERRAGTTIGCCRRARRPRKCGCLACKSISGWPSSDCAGNYAANVWNWPWHRAGLNWRRAWAGCW